MGRRLGMTLMEVVIVLALLAGLAGMTLTSLGDLGNERRVSQTKTRAQTMSRLVLGEGSEAGRFLADMGRLPVLQDAGEGRSLSELFEAPHASVVGGTVSYAIPADLFGPTFSQPLPGIAQLRCGWNGPYLLTEGGRFYDGFGRDWHVRLEGGAGLWRSPANLTATDTGLRILEAVSWGRDGAPGQDAWADADHFVSWDAPAATASLSVQLLMRDNTQMGREAWKPIAQSDPWATYPTWAASEAYAEGQLVRPSDGDELYRCVSPGLSGGSEPTWQSDHIGQQTSDGAATWMLAANRRGHANRVRVALFVPYTPTQPTATEGVELVALRSGLTLGDATIPDRSADMAPWSAAWSGPNGVTYTGLTPGPRKLLACAYIDNGGSPANAWRSALLDVVLKPGGNVVTVHLNEPLESP
jgi:type II secretory pathway pseudopilin PulG